MADLFAEFEWPRITAARICAMPDIEDRRRELAKVPKHLQELVREHVAIYFERKKYAKRI